MEESDYEDVIEQTKQQFSIGQIYDRHKAKVIKCKKCGSTEWNVGVGSYYTAIRCPKCRYELCIHDG